MQNNRIIITVVSFIILVLVITYFSFYKNPPQIGSVFRSAQEGVIWYEYPDTISIDEPFEVTVMVDSKNQPVNAVGLYMRYNPKHLHVIDVDSTESFCQFYPEKKYDNSVGIFSLACGSPHPGFSGVSELIKITFEPLAVTNTTVTTDPKSQILLSDGKGTNIMEDHPSLPISILTKL